MLLLLHGSAGDGLQPRAAALRPQSAIATVNPMTPATENHCSLAPLLTGKLRWAHNFLWRLYCSGGPPRPPSPPPPVQRARRIRVRVYSRDTRGHSLHCSILLQN